jgi:hypothetical protein
MPYSAATVIGILKYMHKEYFFGSIDLLHRDIFTIFNIKSRDFIYNSKHYILIRIGVKFYLVFFDYDLKPSFPLVDSWLDVILR